MDNDELCWADSGKAHIACLSLRDGASLRIVVGEETGGAPRPFGLAVTSATYYWTDWDKMSIMAAPKRNLTAVKALAVPFAMTARLYSIVAVSAVCPQEGTFLTLALDHFLTAVFSSECILQGITADKINIIISRVPYWWLS